MKDSCHDEIELRRPPRQNAGRPKKIPASVPPRIPRVTRLMALAIKFEDMVNRREVRDYAEIARLGYVTRARLTQIMNLLLLSPIVQEQLLFEDSAVPFGVKEPALRSVAALVHWGDQHTDASRMGIVLTAVRPDRP